MICICLYTYFVWFKYTRKIFIWQEEMLADALRFARSIDCFLLQEIGITRVVITTESDAEGKNNEIGQK